MSTTRVLAPVIALASAVLLTTAAPALAKDGDVRTSGACQGVATWKMKASPEDGRIEVEAEVDSNRIGQTWNWTLFHNGNVASRGTSTTAGRSGSFEVRRVRATGPAPTRSGSTRGDPAPSRSAAAWSGSEPGCAARSRHTGRDGAGAGGRRPHDGAHGSGPAPRHRTRPRGRGGGRQRPRGRRPRGGARTRRRADGPPDAGDGRRPRDPRDHLHEPRRRSWCSPPSPTPSGSPTRSTRERWATRSRTPTPTTCSTPSVRSPGASHRFTRGWPGSC